MDKKQQIEEMAHLFCEYFKNGICKVKLKECDIDCEFAMTAEKIYTAGYRKIDDDCAAITKDDLDLYKRQAAKDTAKEILQGLESMSNNGVYQGKLTVPQMRIFFKEHYGVEVEK